MIFKLFSDDINFHLDNKRKISNWIKQVISEEGKKVSNLSFVFVSDEIILDINKKYLKHDYYTDILTFDYSSKDKISGEMYISIDTVKENAKEYCVDFKNELFRVMIHGVLHLCGYNDGSEAEQQNMRALENKYLSNFEY